MDNQKKDILKKSLKKIPKTEMRKDFAGMEEFKKKTSNVEKAVKDSTSPSRFPNVAGKVMKGAATIMFPGATGLSKSVDAIKDIAKSDKMKTLKSKIKNISLNPIKAWSKARGIEKAGENKKQEGYKQNTINDLINDGMDPEDAYNRVNNIG